MEKGSDDGDAKRRTRVRRRSSAMRDVSPTIDCTFDRQINQQLVAGGGLSSPCASGRATSSFNWEMFAGLVRESAGTVLKCNAASIMVFA